MTANSIAATASLDRRREAKHSSSVTAVAS